MTEDERRHALLERLQRVERIVRADLLAQYRAEPALRARALARLRDEENDTSQSETWLEIFAGRAAAIYILKSLYVRVLEDQRLLATTRIRDEGTFSLFRTLFPLLGHAAYLRTVYAEAERALPELFARTAIEIAEPSESSAHALWSVWQEAAPGGGPLFDFRDQHLDTRFIGDLYQDLDPDVRKRYALYQTPHFIEAFILDRTLEPALKSVGLAEFRIIDPTCGSGHFLLGAFNRLFTAWCAELGGGDAVRWEAARRALDAIYGCDINEYACALSRFRLLLGVFAVTGVRNLTRLRFLECHVLACDALIPWERISQEFLPGTTGSTWLARYGSDIERERNEAFFAREFHAVVGNPPYIAVQDKKKRKDYRSAWPRSASGLYSLSAPMTERFCTLPSSRGRFGFIVGKAFCNAEFGKGVVTKVLPDLTLDLVVDTSGIGLSGHGTPTMIICGRNLPAAAAHNTMTIASLKGNLLGARDSEDGPPWTEIASHFEADGYESQWISVAARPQFELLRHPWVFGSTSQHQVQEHLASFPSLKSINPDVGFCLVIKEDEIFSRRYVPEGLSRDIVPGKFIRNWTIGGSISTLFPYDNNRSVKAEAEGELWPYRSNLFARATFEGTFRSSGRRFAEFGQVSWDRIAKGVTAIAYAEITSHNHFVVSSLNDRLFDRTSPIIRFPTLGEVQASQNFLNDVAAILNSSIVEWWFKSRCRIKNGSGEPWQWQYARNGENIKSTPIEQTGRTNRRGLVALISSLQQKLENSSPGIIFRFATAENVADLIAAAEQIVSRNRGLLYALQEELDWTLYGDYGFCDKLIYAKPEEVEPILLGHRAFEIAAEQANENSNMSWLADQGAQVTSQIPDEYSAETRDLIAKRIERIQNSELIAAFEQPSFKRRWSFGNWENALQSAAREWLLDAVEKFLGETRQLNPVREIVARLRDDPKAVVIGAYAKFEQDVDLVDTVSRLLSDESIPDNPARLFKPIGLEKLVGSQTADTGSPTAPPIAREFTAGEAVDWKRVWRLQEREDAGERVSVAVPPPFKDADYAHPNGWRIRGKFNVPNERFIVYDELTPKRYAWGGWSLAERARLSSEAFDLRGAEPDGASEQPTLQDPRRCGIQFPLWDKLDELRRTNDPTYEEAKMLAQLCGRACPCDVLPLWRDVEGPRRGRAVPKFAAVVQKPAQIEPALVAAALAKIEAAGPDGIARDGLEDIFAGNRDAVLSALDALRANGQIEAIGRGRRQRFRAPEGKLFA